MNEYDFASVFIEGLSNMEIAVAVIGILSAASFAVYEADERWCDHFMQ